MEKKELHKILDELGIKYDKRWKVEKLEALMGDVEIGDRALEEVKKEVEAPRVPKPQSIKIVATFKTRTKEGDRIMHKYIGEGLSPEEALDNVVCVGPEELNNEPWSLLGKPWPKGCNRLIDMKVKRGDYEFSRALAPHKARQILEDKNVIPLKALFSL